jgi:hypothetical protein
MENPNQTTPAKALPKLIQGQAFISGRIAFRRRMKTTDGSYWMTVLKTPAPDSFSHPGTIEVMSDQSIGNTGDDWSGIVTLTGYPRSYDGKPDPQTGEIQRIHTADNRLRVVE